MAQPACAGFADDDCGGVVGKGLIIRFHKHAAAAVDAVMIVFDDDDGCAGLVEFAQGGNAWHAVGDVAEFFIYGLFDKFARRQNDSRVNLESNGVSVVDLDDHADDLLACRAAGEARLVAVGDAADCDQVVVVVKEADFSDGKVAFFFGDEQLGDDLLLVVLVNFQHIEACAVHFARQGCGCG